MPALGERDEPEFFRDATVYREWGYRFTITDRLREAIVCFRKSLGQSKGNDLRALLGLCRAQIKHTRYTNATETSEKCMEIDPHHYQVKHLRVETLYNVGEFAFSLAHAYQGLKDRLMPFEYEVYQGIEAIEDCVGRNTHTKALLILYPWIRELQAYREKLIEKLGEEPDEFEGIDEDHSRFKVNDATVRTDVRLRKLHHIIAEMFLGALAKDKDFVEEIVERPDRINSPNKKSTAVLLMLASGCYRRSCLRQERIRMRRPLYVTLFERRARPPGHKASLKLDKQLRRNNIVIEADFLLRKAHDVRMAKDYLAFFSLVDRIKDKFDSYSLDMFPYKEKCSIALYNMVAWVYIDTKNLTCLESERIKKLYLKQHLGVGTTVLPRDSDIAWVHRINRNATFRLFRRRLAMASQPLELAWLFHEFSKFLIIIGRLDLARFFTKKTRDTAQEAKSSLWVLHSYHLLLRIEIIQHNRNEAKDAALLALAASKKIGLDFLVDFYKRVIEMIEDSDMEGMINTDSIAARQQLILDLMPEEMKPDVDFLWRSMEVVPAKRRLSVMPGCKPVDRKFKMPCKRRSILPGPPKDPEREARIALLKQYAPSTERPGFVDFSSCD